MSDLSITDLLRAYGMWAANDLISLDCKSPSLMLMRSAPHLCKDVKLSRKSTTKLFISDEDALAVDRALKSLRTYSVLLYRIVIWRYVRGHSERGITEYLNATEQTKFTRIKVKNLLERAHGFIASKLVD